MRILIATDGSDLALDAARRATRLFPDAQITLLHVVSFSDLSTADLLGDSGMAGSGMSAEAAKKRDDQRFAEADGILAATAAAVGVREVERRLEVGDPATAVCDIADELDADVIITGTHGRGAIGQVVLGSVSQHVVRHAPCPVLVVAPRAGSSP